MTSRLLFGAALVALVGTGCGGQTGAQPADAGTGDTGPMQNPPPMDGGVADTFVPAADAGAPDAEAGAREASAPESGAPEASVPDGGTPAEAGCSTACPHNYAIEQVFLGDTDRSGNSSPTAWENYGQDLDGLVTTASSTNVCTLAPGAVISVQVDGTAGIDNSWGANLLPLFEELDAEFPQAINETIGEGLFTNMFTVSGFDDTAGNMTSATGLSGVTLLGGDYMAFGSGGLPAWNTSTAWPINPASLDCPATGCPAGTNPVTAALGQFGMSAQAGGIFLSAPPFDFPFTFPLLSGSDVTVPVHGTALSFAPLKPGSVTNGTVAGAMMATDFVQALNTLLGADEPTLCGGSALQAIDEEILQDADIVYDPSSGIVSNMAGVACNAISIGIGFNATEIALPTPADIEAPVPAAAGCPATDAGAMDGSAAADGG